VAHADPPSPKILLAAGPRAAEEAVFAWLEERLDGEGRGVDRELDLPERLALLARPLRVVVASDSLRQHLAAELVRRRGRSAAGVVVQTLSRLTEDVLERKGFDEASATAAPRKRAGGALLHVLVRRLGREIPDLAEHLEELADGYGPVAATVRDFLDAGLELELADGVADAALQTGEATGDPADDAGRVVGTVSERVRAEALVRLAAGVERALQAMNLDLPGHRLRRAAECLEEDPGLLPCRGVLVHGFADATGVAGALIEALLRRLGATVVLDRPPDPAHPTGAEAPLPDGRDDRRGGLETGFTRRFLERLAVRAETVELADEVQTEPAPAILQTLSAPGADAEARLVARRIRALLDRSERPEGIAVVARSLRPDQPFATAFRRHFTRLGIPFSGAGGAGSGAGPLLPAGRRLRALLDVLRRREGVPTDRWLDALGDAAAAPTGPTDPAGPAGPTGDADAPDATDGPARPAGTPHLDLSLARRLELRLALHTLGAARLGDVARIDPGRLRRFEESGFPLPIREGIHAVGGDDGGDGPDGTDDDAGDADPAERSLRRRVPVAVIHRAIDAAGRLVRSLADWADSTDRADRLEPAPVASHLARLRRLLADELGWIVPGGNRAWRNGSGSEPSADPLWGPIDALASQAPGRLTLSYDEMVLLVAHALEDAGRDAVGGAGGGVALLDAMEARGRTFEHLFLVGLNRGVFPRPIREDPLLADDLRQLLLSVLADLPVKRRGFDEERHLFAQLVAAAPDVTLSWQSTTADGQPNPRSPLVERMERLEPVGDAASPAPPPATLRPAADHAMAAGLAGDRQAFERLVAIALREDRTEIDAHADAHSPARAAPAADGGDAPSSSNSSWGDLAAAHRRILDEVDPDLSAPDGWSRFQALGPYFGLVGPAGADDPGDPRHAALWVTTLERLAACPWQTFLGRVLRVEPTPDPLQAAPSLDALLVGSLVHAVLEEVVNAALPDDGGTQDRGKARGKTLEEADAREPVEVPWPAPAALEEILHRRATRLLQDEGIALPGLERALAAAARPYMETARQVEWQPRSPSVLAAEVTGTVTVTDAAGAARALHFRADRVDRMVDRRFPGLRLTDYKTGKPISDAVKQKTRDEHFLRQVEAGDRLQAVAYALATGGPLPSMHAGQGRYVFLRQGLPPEQREFTVWGSHVPFVDAFQAAVGSGLAAWDRGTFFPRLVDPDRDQEPRRCSWCALHEACVRGDSGARRRLAAWADNQRQGILAAVAEGGDGATGTEPAGTDSREARQAASALLGVWTLPSRSKRSGDGGAA